MSRLLEQTVQTKLRRVLQLGLVGIPGVGRDLVVLLYIPHLGAVQASAWFNTSYQMFIENAKIANMSKNNQSCQWELYIFYNTICPRSSAPFYTVNYYIKWVTPCWTYNK